LFSEGEGGRRNNRRLKGGETARPKKKAEARWAKRCGVGPVCGKGKEKAQNSRKGTEKEGGSAEHQQKQELDRTNGGKEKDEARYDRTGR